MNIAYFVHDLSDPAVEKRVRMLLAGGGSPSLIGFRRGPKPVSEVAGVAALDLGRTYGGRLTHRALSALMAWGSAGGLAEWTGRAEVVMARNLEMLLIAERARRLTAPRARLVYECLDIHRLMLSGGQAGRGLRWLERRLLARCDLLLTSSPAYLREYFAGRHSGISTRLVENKVLSLAPAADLPRLPPQGPPWRIGWFGAIRCRKSLDILAGLAEALPGKVEVVIRGRPAEDLFGDFSALAERPGVRFLGPYTAEDLADIYSEAHFAWAADFFEQGLNSAWLLPNRLYEGGRYGVPALALKGVETGRWLEAHAIGATFADLGDPLVQFFDRLTPASYQRLRDQVAAQPASVFAFDRADCVELVRALAAPSPDA